MSLIAQNDEMTLLVNRIDLDRNNIEKREYEAFVKINDEFYPGSFYFKGTTFSTPYSPCYCWKLFLEDSTLIEISLTDDKGSKVINKYTETLQPGAYKIEVDNLLPIEKSSFFYLQVKSKYKTSTIQFYVWGPAGLAPIDAFIVKNLETSTILSDSLSLQTTINKKSKTHFDGWLLNVPSFRPVVFQLFSENDTLSESYQSMALHSGLYEVLLDSSVTSGKYRLVIESYDAKLEEVFTLIR
jgi:hypothetical protein